MYGNPFDFARLTDIAPTVSNTVTKAYVESLGIESGVDAQTVTNMTVLTPVYSPTPTFSEWVCTPSTYNGKTLHVVFGNEEWYLYADSTFLDPPETGDDTVTNLTFSVYGVTASRVRTDIIGYTLGGQTTKPLQPQGDYYQKPSGGVPKTDLTSAVQTSLGLADTAVQPSDLAGLMPMYPFSAPTMTQTDWTFSGADAASGYHWECVYDGYDGKWNLYEVPDGSTWEDVSVASDQISEDIDGTETSLTFGSASVTATRGYVATVAPYTIATYTADSTASAFEIAVGALPTGVTGKARDCILVIDCTATGAVAPTVTWGTHFHPRTDTATDLAIVEAGKRAVFYISEYAPGEFAVGGWVETAGGSGT